MNANESKGVQAVLGVSARAIKVAACLAERYVCPEGAAFGRVQSSASEWRMWSGKFRRVAPSPRRDQFWQSVAGLLVSAYIRRGCATNYEAAARRAIEAARADLARAGGAA